MARLMPQLERLNRLPPVTSTPVDLATMAQSSVGEETYF